MCNARVLERAGWRRAAGLGVVLLVLAVGGAWGQGAAGQRPVARLSHLEGSVNVVLEDATQAPFDAALNMPLTAGERLTAGENGAAEVEFRDGSVLRMTPGSVATLERLDADSKETAIGLNDGLFYLELRRSAEGSFRIDAGEVTLVPEENASIRVRVHDGQVETAALSGTVSVTRANAYTAEVQAGESLRSDPKNGRRYLLADSVPGESWDGWNERLSQAALDEAGTRTAVRDGYAGEQAYGWGDLDASGSWYDVPGEGQVWQPMLGLDASFDPYANGSWVYGGGGGGYTWASGYGWGWLPYRCGSWGFYGGFGWGWIPSSGCRSFGFGGGYGGYGGYGGEGGGGGGFRVRHPPEGWHPPRRPVDTENGGILRRHPTVPILFRPRDPGVIGAPPLHRIDVPVKIGSATVLPVRRIGHEATPHGGSAVGSSLTRDFPVRMGTHEPVIGVVSQAPVALPGRPAEWHGVTPVARGSGGAGGAVTGTRGRAGEVVGYGGGGYGGGGYGGVGPGVPVGGFPVDRGQADGYAGGRVPRATDPPVNATGAPPFGANGPPPVNATGAPPFGANGSPVGGNGSTVVPGSGVLPGGGGAAPQVFSGYRGLNRERDGGGGGRTVLPMRPTGPGPSVGVRPVPAAPMVIAPVRPMTLPAAGPAAPPMRMSAPAPAAPMRMSPPPAPAAPMSAPAPSAPATARPR